MTTLADQLAHSKAIFEICEGLAQLRKDLDGFVMGGSFTCGSAFVCNPPVLDTDLDAVVAVTGYPCAIWAALEPLGYTNCSKVGENYPEDDHCIVRKGRMNFIIVTTPTRYEQWKKATDICKALNLTDKADRVVVYQIMRGEL